MRSVVRLVIFVSIFFLLHGLVLLFKHVLETPASSALKSEETPLVVTPSASNDGQKSRINATLCQYNECLKGRWIPREPAFASLAEFQAAFATRSSSVWHRCAVPPPAPGETRTAEETTKLEQQRLVDIMNWVWQPERGKVIPWDPEDFVVRLLKTPGGIIFMGDSISQGHEHAFGSYLQQGGIQFDMDPPHLSSINKDPHVRSHVLRPNSPMTLKLQKRAGVPDSRLQYPIFTVIEEHMVIHEPDIRFITEQYGATKGFRWYLDMKRTDDWEGFLKRVTQRRPGEENVVTGDTILVLNTGAHWSRGTLHMLPDRETPSQEQGRVTLVYQQMVKMVMQRISAVQNLTVFYRATNPAHPGCGTKPKPYTSYADAYSVEHNISEVMSASAKDDNDRRVKLRWDWDLFNVHNYVWRKEIARVDRERKALLDRYPDKPPSPGVKWLFLDLWEMSLQRPDAHSEPGKDCLHWCLPAVYAQWTEHLYHLLYLEMEQ